MAVFRNTAWAHNWSWRIGTGASAWHFGGSTDTNCPIDLRCVMKTSETRPREIDLYPHSFQKHISRALLPPPHYSNTHCECSIQRIFMTIVLSVFDVKFKSCPNLKVARGRAEAVIRAGGRSWESWQEQCLVSGVDSLEKNIFYIWKQQIFSHNARTHRCIQIVDIHMHTIVCARVYIKWTCRIETSLYQGRRSTKVGSRAKYTQ